MANSTMLAVLGQIVCYTGRQLSWKKTITADFAFQHLTAIFRQNRLSSRDRSALPGAVR